MRKILVRALPTLMFAIVACGDDDEGGGLNNAPSASDITASCQGVCDRTFECLEVAFPGTITAEDRADCVTSCQEAEPSPGTEITPECLNAANAALACVTAAECNALATGSCTPQINAAAAACSTDVPDTPVGPPVGPVACSAIDCSACGNPSAQNLCTMNLNACQGNADCCGAVNALYGGTCNNVGQPCDFSCSACSESLAPLCESARNLCSAVTFNDANWTACCQGQASFYASECGG